MSSSLSSSAGGVLLLLRLLDVLFVRSRGMRERELEDASAPGNVELEVHLEVPERFMPRDVAKALIEELIDEAGR